MLPNQSIFVDTIALREAKAIKEEGGITINSLIKIYQRIKQTYDGIRPYQAEIGETFYTPPRGKGVVEKMLADMVEFLNDDQRYPIDPLLKMAMAEQAEFFVFFILSTKVFLICRFCISVHTLFKTKTTIPML